MKINNLIKPQDNSFPTVNDYTQGDVIYFATKDFGEDYPYLISDSDFWFVGIGKYNLGQTISLKDERFEYLYFVPAIKVNAEITLKN